MNRNLLAAILLAFSTALFYACTHDTDTPVPATPGGNTGGNTGGGNNGGNSGGNNGGNNGGNAPDTALCFERDILPIFQSNCAKSGCHDVASRQDGFVFTSWETITAKKFEPGNPDETELYETITEDKVSKRMPKYPNPPLSAQQISMIRRWIEMGAPNTKNCGSNTGCDSNQFTFASVIRPILNNNCVGCHNNTLRSAGFTYESHTGVVAAVNSGRFLGALRHDAGFKAMPQGGSKLSACDILRIEKWVAAGMPDN